MRVGDLRSLKVGDLEKINDIYKVIVYSGDKENKLTLRLLNALKK